MNRHTIKKVAGGLIGALIVFYVALLLRNFGDEIPMQRQNVNADRQNTVAIFGATGTIGGGLLKAAISDPNVDRVRVITRRPSPRIEAGVHSGKVEMTIHKNYLDYSSIRDVLADVDTVYWAIGLSAVGLDENTYREIHVDFPVELLSQWLEASDKNDRSLHYVSGSGASAKSRMMWARVKAEAESALEQVAESTGVRLASYRPALILPTEGEAHLGHRIMYAIFAPIKSAVAAESIGHAMFEVSARSQQYQNGAVLENREIVGLGDAYRERTQ